MGKIFEKDHRSLQIRLSEFFSLDKIRTYVEFWCWLSASNLHVQLVQNVLNGIEWIVSVSVGEVLCRQLVCFRPIVFVQCRMYWIHLFCFFSVCHHGRLDPHLILGNCMAALECTQLWCLFGIFWHFYDWLAFWWLAAKPLLRIGTINAKEWLETNVPL